MTRVPVWIVPLTWGAFLAWGHTAVHAAPLGRERIEQTVAFVRAPGGDPSTPGDLDRSLLATRYREGMQLALADVSETARAVRIVSEGFVSAADPAISHDGRSILFAGRRTASDRYQIWEVDPAGRMLRKVSSTTADSIGPVYGSNGQIVFSSFEAGEFEEHGGARSLSLYTLHPGEETATRITFNPSSDFDPLVLLDGRVLYSSWQHVGNHHWPTGNIALMLINSDGTGVFPLTGNHRRPWMKRGTSLWEDERVVFVQDDRLDEWGSGTLVATTLNDPFARYQEVISGKSFRVEGAAPLADGRLLVSAKPTDGSRDTFGLYVVDSLGVTLLYDDPAYHELSPATARGAEPEFRVSTVVPGTPFGYVAVLDCYESDREPRRPLRDGIIRALRVIQGKPLREEGSAGPTFQAAPGAAEPLVHPGSATGYIPSEILGEVPLAPDGSVYLKVPADRPLRFQLVDRDGFAVVDERAWLWVRPNERRVCIGCHENRELAPRNAVPLATRRTPTDLTDESEWQSVSFRNDIEPILRTTCAVAGCHVPPRPTAGMNLSTDRLWPEGDAELTEHFGPAYSNILKRQEGKPFGVGGRRVHPGDARRSPLLWMLYGRALAPQYQPGPFDRPITSAHPGPMLPESQLELFRKWVDLGAIYNDEVPSGDWPYSIQPAGEVATEKHADDASP